MESDDFVNRPGRRYVLNRRVLASDGQQLAERGDIGPEGAVVLDIRGLEKSFGSLQAVRNVSLQVRRGELIVLLGRSGAGKSTVLRCINGMHTASAGTVNVFGIDPAKAGRSELCDLRRRVGFVFQQFGLVGRLTALGNVLAGSLGRLKWPRYDISSYPQHMRQEAVVQLARVGLADRAYQRADTLSGGQQQRVAIARAVFQKPDLMLADEPVASLDPETSEQVMQIFFQICREDQLTVVCSLHQLDLALGWADRMVGMRAGEIVLDAAAHTLNHDEAMQVYKDQAVTADDTGGGS